MENTSGTIPSLLTETWGLKTRAFTGALNKDGLTWLRPKSTRSFAPTTMSLQTYYNSVLLYSYIGATLCKDLIYDEIL